MTAAAHIRDALTEVRNLETTIGLLIDATRLGREVGLDDLSNLRHSAQVIRANAGVAARDLERMPQLERREERRPNLVGVAATSPEAMKCARELHEALVASTEKLVELVGDSLDRGTSLQYAASQAHTACVQSREVLPAAEKLHGTLWLPIGEVA